MRTSIIVVDGFLDDPMETRAEALRMPFTEHPEYHKGMRAPGGPVPPSIAAHLLRLVGGSRLSDSSYSCFQCCVAGTPLVFHSDTQHWAACIYLTPDAPPASGTSFYRSRHFPRVRSSEDIKEFTIDNSGDLDAPDSGPTVVWTAAELEQYVYGDKLLDRTAWEEIDRVGNVFNRLVVWDAHLIHAATDYFGTGVEDGRLFMMAFFDIE